MDVKMDFSFLNWFIGIGLVVFLVGFMIAALPGWVWFAILLGLIIVGVVK